MSAPTVSTPWVVATPSEFYKYIKQREKTEKDFYAAKDKLGDKKAGNIFEKGMLVYAKIGKELIKFVNKNILHDKM